MYSRQNDVCVKDFMDNAATNSIYATDWPLLASGLHHYYSKKDTQDIREMVTVPAELKALYSSDSQTLGQNSFEADSFLWVPIIIQPRKHLFSKNIMICRSNFWSE